MGFIYSFSLICFVVGTRLSFVKTSIHENNPVKRYVNGETDEIIGNSIMCIGENETGKGTEGNDESIV